MPSLTDAALRQAYRRVQENPGDEEAQWALLGARLRAGDFPPKSVRSKLVTALYKRWRQRMLALPAIPLGPILPRPHPGQVDDHPGGLVVGRGFRTTAVFTYPANTWMAPDRLSEPGSRRLSEASMVQTEDISLRFYDVHEAGPSWLWVIPDSELVDAIESQYYREPTYGLSPRPASALIRAYQRDDEGQQWCYRTAIHARPGEPWQIKTEPPLRLGSSPNLLDEVEG